MEINKIFKRQLGLVRPKELEFPILVIGAGGIGSWATFALAKMGCQNIHVVDFDTVEPHNIPSQLYKPEQVGQTKVEALRDLIKELTGLVITPIHKRFQEYRETDYLPVKAIICAVDSLEQRKEIWNTLVDHWFLERDFDFYIDARMGGELLRILAVNPHDNKSINYYQTRLFRKGSKASVEPCTARSVVYNTFVCGGFIASLVKKYAKREEVRTDFTIDLTTTQLI
jgi:hypothetical protein